MPQTQAGYIFSQGDKMQAKSKLPTTTLLFQQNTKAKLDKAFEPKQPYMASEPKQL